MQQSQSLFWTKMTKLVTENKLNCQKYKNITISTVKSNANKVDYPFHADKSYAENLPVLQTNQLENDIRKMLRSLQ